MNKTITMERGKGRAVLRSHGTKGGSGNGTKTARQFIQELVDELPDLDITIPSGESIEVGINVRINGKVFLIQA